MTTSSDSPGGTGGRIPSVRVGKLLEIGGGEIRARKVDGIFDLRCDRQPLITVGHRVDVVVLRDCRFSAVGRAVLTHVAGAKICRYDFKIAHANLTARAGCKFPLS